jgi:flagellar motor switch protein FliN/FliY
MAILSQKPPAKSPAVTPAELDRILQIRVPVIVKLAQRKISLQEVLRLTTGSIVEFHKSSDDPLELLINNKSIGVGLAVKVGENFGIKLTQVGDVRAIVAAMSSK